MTLETGWQPFIQAVRLAALIMWGMVFVFRLPAVKVALRDHAAADWREVSLWIVSIGIMWLQLRTFGDAPPLRDDFNTFGGWLLVAIAPTFVAMNTARKIPTIKRRRFLICHLIMLACLSAMGAMLWLGSHG